MNNAYPIQLFKSLHIAYLGYICSVIILFLFTLLPQIPESFIYVPLALAFLAIFFDLIQDLRKSQFGSSNFFFIFATVIGIAAHEEKAITIVLIILLIANYLHHVIEDRTQQAIKDLIYLIPQEAIIKVNGNYQTVPVTQIKPGDLVVVKTGSSIGVDGIIVQGSASINEAALTGESVPKTKSVHDLVFAGTYVEDGSIILKAQQVGKNTALGKISALIEQTQKQKAPIISITDRVALYVTAFFVFFILIVWFFTRDLRMITTLLVFGSPLELTLITPLTILAGIACAFKNGVIVKGGQSLEQLAKVNTMVFDKTGTLTMGHVRVVDIHIFDKTWTEHEVIKYAAIAEKRSGHPISKAIVKKAEELGISIPEPEQYIALTGHGIEIMFEGNRYLVGNRHFVQASEHGNINMDQIPEFKATTSYLAKNKSIIAAFIIADEIRTDAQNMITKLKKLGIKQLLILSGDTQDIAQQVAQKLGIEKAYGQIMPDEKLTIIDQLMHNKNVVAMVGDGINDAPALQHASVGIAMGAMQTEPAIQAADIVLMSNNLQLIVFIYRLSKQAFKIIMQNIVWGLFFTHALGIILGLMRFLNPVQAALFHAVPEIIIFLNTARVLLYKPES